MSALRTAAVVLFAVAAIDAVMDGIEIVAGRIGGTGPVNLWPVLLGTAAALVVVDLLIDRRNVLGRKCHDMMEWLAAKFRNALAFTKATTVGSGAVIDEPPPRAENTPPQKDSSPAGTTSSDTASG